MTVPDDDPEWRAFVAAMEAHQRCTLVMLVAADFLQERGDPRWEPLMWLAENGKVGSKAAEWTPTRSHGGTTAGQYNYDPFPFDTGPEGIIRRDWYDGTDWHGEGVVFKRLDLIRKWAMATPEQQREWLTDPCRAADGGGQ